MRYGIAIVVVMAFLAGCTTGGTKVTSTWKDPELRQELTGPVIVFARLNEPGTRRIVEDRTVTELRKREIDARPAYRALPEMAVTEAAVSDQAKAAGASALMLYTMSGQYTDLTRAPGVSPGVGIGPFGVSVGPVIGGSRPEQRSAIDVQLFPAGSSQPVWAGHYDINLKRGLKQGIEDVPARAIEQARTDKALR